MPIQLALQFDDVPVTCEVQRRYHILVPVLAGRSSRSPSRHKLSTSATPPSPAGCISSVPKGCPGCFLSRTMPVGPTHRNGSLSPCCTSSAVLPKPPHGNWRGLLARKPATRCTIKPYKHSWSVIFFGNTLSLRIIFAIQYPMTHQPDVWRWSSCTGPVGARRRLLTCLVAHGEPLLSGYAAGYKKPNSNRPNRVGCRTVLMGRSAWAGKQP